MERCSYRRTVNWWVCIRVRKEIDGYYLTALKANNSHVNILGIMPWAVQNGNAVRIQGKVPLNRAKMESHAPYYLLPDFDIYLSTSHEKEPTLDDYAYTAFRTETTLQKEAQ